MKIRKSQLADIPRMLEIYAFAREQMKKNGNATQWVSYPQKEVLEQDIAEQNSYVVEAEGKVCATFAFLLGEDPTYAIIEEGAWLNDESYAAVHRVASDGTQKGVLAAIMEYCAAYTPNIRIDTHENNKIMQHLLEKQGFSRCGIIYLADDVSEHSKRIAYQKCW